MGYKPIKRYDFLSAPDSISIVKLSEEDLVEIMAEDKYARDPERNHVIYINGEILCYHKQYMDQSKLTLTLFRFTLKGADSVMQQLLALSTEEFPYYVSEFNYGGFGGTVNEKVIMPYKARFLEWTGDPGVAKMDCSDGKERVIPTFAIPFSFETMPNDLTRVQRDGNVQFFGAPSKS